MRNAIASFLLLFPAVLLAEDRASERGFVITEEEKAVLDLTNAQRKAAGLQALVPSEKLFQAARAHSTNMARQGKLDHTLDGRDMGSRIKAAGYSFLAAGENIAWNPRDAESAMRTWMGSDGHRANILSREFTEVGVAVMTNSRGERYWTQVFARPH